ncbi:hypothetical protein roselon_03264 [Roseibacterium elongatum DSM 19469]|uniref:Uncharacterized protein n=1 Tax=Roseicyclus elongatus DSM 19469 TaxID=1294273 RepID=W8RWF8_9RHOB|nr:hypothetical protein [Roseibacterium elongatum]AHM05524.1 hypothetical protein roselon_03264 [Roseibacterium elongatum DSM 19469]
MQVVFHLGAPCTDHDLLIQALIKNRNHLMSEGTAVPPPGRYRSVLRDTARALKGRAASAEVEEALLDAILDDFDVDRLVLSDPRFICINRLVIQGAQIWPMIDRQTAQLRAMFPSAEVEFFIGMRDPATHIPALFRASRFTDFGEFSENMQPHAVAWSEMLRRLRMAHPECPVTVWCNEDTPLLWGEILRELGGLSPNAPLEGADDLVETIMEPAGFARMQDYLAEHPPQTEAQRRRVVAAFLERYACEEAIQVELDLPGWSADYIDALSDAYDEDMAEVARIPGVTCLTP